MFIRRTGYITALFSIFLLSLTDIFTPTMAGTLLNALKYYEKLHSSDLNHVIIKRGLQPSNNKYNTIKQLSFKALGRNFQLMLTPSTEVLSSQFQAYSVDALGNKEPIWVDRDHFYDGRVFGEVNSHASVHFENNLLTATIQTTENTYIIEPSWRHFSDEEDQSMIAYRGSDVRFGSDHGNNAQKRMKICGYLNEGPVLGSEQPLLGRTKRQQTEAAKAKLSRTRCALLLVADHHFYRSMGGGSKKTTLNYLITLMDRVHRIFNQTDWHGSSNDEGLKGMGFTIEEIIIHTEPTAVLPGQHHYNMDRKRWEVREMLEIFSREPKISGYCLAHLFTNTQFESGILGLAYVGSPRPLSVGGICTQEYIKDGHTLYLNSGLSTSQNHYGKRLLTREAELVTAHEFGHNWGSEHDPANFECSPNSSHGGSFLMYTYSVSGHERNHKVFSPCSLRSIRAVLKAKSQACFKEPQESLCGNSRVEGKEECDVGWIASKAEDPCCERNCTLKSNAKCSDKNSPCCNDCTVLPSGIQCRDANPNTCEKESVCNGLSAECPLAEAEEDGTACLDRGQCKSGRCASYCETKNMQPCMCDEETQECLRCCWNSATQNCSAVQPYDILMDGTPCIRGICNKGVCEKRVQDIIERFWSIIENIDINSVRKFINDNIVGTVLIISILLWLPASCLVNYVDRKRAAENQNREEWLARRNTTLIHEADKPMRLVKIPRRRLSGTDNACFEGQS